MRASCTRLSNSAGSIWTDLCSSKAPCSASIIFQLLTAAVPALAKIAGEKDAVAADAADLRRHDCRACPQQERHEHADPEHERDGEEADQGVADAALTACDDRADGAPAPIGADDRRARLLAQVAPDGFEDAQRRVVIQANVRGRDMGPQALQFFFDIGFGCQQNRFLV